MIFRRWRIRRLQRKREVLKAECASLDDLVGKYENIPGDIVHRRAELHGHIADIEWRLTYKYRAPLTP